MYKLAAILFFLPLFINASAQKSTVHVKKKVKSDSVYTVAQIMPKFNGDIYKYIAEHLHYPEVERDAGISGTVYISFIVEKDSSLSNVSVMKGVPGGPGLNKEAMWVISTMPKWIPGSQNGQLVRVKYNMPIRFKLE